MIMEGYTGKITDYIETDTKVIEAKLRLSLPQLERELNALTPRIPIPWDLEFNV
jgi:hypothetical protein